MGIRMIDLAPISMPVTDCPRCGGDHKAVVLTPLSKPTRAGDIHLTHWAPCPENGEPIIAAPGLHPRLQEVTHA